ncbi:MAG: hypothetical protein Crog4KO_08040 [Crocinitomicaceae bacterium]
MRIKLSFLFLVLTASVFAQSRVNINNNAFIVIQDSAVLVLENSSDNALFVSGTGGNVVSEGELNRIDWHVSNTTGTYTIPYTTTPVVLGGNGTKIPLTLEVTAAGSNSGYISFSTYETATDDNLAYPTGVSTMNNTSGTNGAYEVVDRFWIVDTNNYTVVPTATMSITYDDAANEIGGLNTITESALQAQRWNPQANSWEGLLFGTTNDVTNITSSINVAPEFYPVWTLVSNLYPLPIELMQFDVTCNDDEVFIQWATLTETNNDYFDIEHSIDGVSFESIEVIDGAGTTLSTKMYSTKSRFTSGYFRITSVDYDGQRTVYDSHIRNVNCSSGDWKVVPNPSNGWISVSGDTQTQRTVHILDASGREIRSGLITNSKIDLSTVSPGVYFAQVVDSNELITLRFVVR